MAAAEGEDARGFGGGGGVARGPALVPIGAACALKELGGELDLAEAVDAVEPGGVDEGHDGAGADAGPAAVRCGIEGCGAGPGEICNFDRSKDVLSQFSGISGPAGVGGVK